ncbi:MAG: flagellar motor protein, partial [Dolichospermum sp.]
ARRSRYTQYNEDLNVWPAFTDLMSNAFMILVLFLFLTIIISQINKSEINNIDKNAQNSKQLALKVKQLQQQVKYLQIQLESDKKSTDAPPIIVIKDEGAYRFASGSAEISQEMSNYILQKIVPEIEARTK